MNPRKSPHSRRALAGLGMLLALTLLCTNAWAQQPPGDLSDSGVRERLDWIDARLADAQRPARLWWRGWLLFNSSVIVVRGAPAIYADDPDDRVAGGTAGFMGAVGVINQMISPFQTHVAAERLHAWPDATPEERRAKLARAERLLEQSAEGERRGVHWTAHAGGILAAAASGAFVYTYGRHDDGYRQAAGVLITSEITIWTQPRRAMRAWDEYRDRYAPSEADPGSRTTIDWQVWPTPGGLTLAARFW